MAKTVWKYQLDPRFGTFDGFVPGSKKVVRFAFQGQIMCVWMEVDPTNHGGNKVSLQAFGTGRPIPDHAQHLASCATPDGDFVFHLYDMARE